MSEDTAKRRQDILRLLDKEPYLSIAALAKRLNLSEPTIRRDIRALSQEGKLTRVRGGAVSRSSVPAESPFQARYTAQRDAKRAIAAAAARLVHSLSVIALDIGTTPLYLAEALVDHNITVVTNNVRATAILSQKISNVMLAGGRIRPGELSVVGSAGLRFLRNYQFDLFFMSAAGISDRGITDVNLDEIEMKREMRLRSARTVVLADHTKFGHPSGLVVCGLKDVDLIITDRPPAPDLAEMLRSEGVEVWVADACSPVSSEAGAALSDLGAEGRTLAETAAGAAPRGSAADAEHLDLLL
ncbi:MAG: DeoR/GlpR family DNA-binding transcription regulator [Alicyclobacillus sp.]|nr:DeoR/GlpR family DNA-binding transcription regulator [Alicyclobacillus sp.]